MKNTGLEHKEFGATFEIKRVEKIKFIKASHMLPIHAYTDISDLHLST